MKNYKMEIFGLSEFDIVSLHEILGEDFKITQNKPNVRTGVELVSAAFFLGALKVAPSLIKAITDFLAEIRKTKHITFKFSNEDGTKVIEGVGSIEKIEELEVKMKDILGG